MSRLWLLALVPLALVLADEATDPEGLGPISESAKENGEFHVTIGRWSQCSDEHTFWARKRFRAGLEPDSLVHHPRLGLQKRSVMCRTKKGFPVLPMYCGDSIKGIGETRVCVVREDCSLGEWLPWRPRADGALVRSRRLRRLPQGGGQECDVVEEVRPAAPETSAHWAPGPWGECRVAVEQPATPMPPADEDDDAEADDAIYDDDDADDLADKETGGASCGGGIQRREATCVSPDGRALHPAQCAHAQLPTLVQPCEVPCPRDCEVGEWSEWEPCQPTDGCPLYPVQQLTTTGYSIRRRRVATAASGGGAPCPPLEEKRACSAPRCAAWQALPWGPCVLSQPHDVCGPGRRSRELRCIGHDGKEAQRAWCSASGAPARTEKCRIACAGDCVVSAWGPWAPCSAPCAAPHPRPTTTRRRHILAHNSPNGWPCPSAEQLVQNETCNTHACATYSWLATPWGPCRPTHDYQPADNYTELQDGDAVNENDEEEPCVEEGEMTRDVMCVQNNADVVREVLCTPLHRPASRRACTIRCRRGCRVEAWQPWSKCPNTCEPAQQVRVRIVSGGPNCGPLQETRPCPAVASCSAPEPTWEAGQWTPCQVPPGPNGRQTCGHGYRVRSIWCGSDAHRVEAGACAGKRVPRMIAPCSVPCARSKPSTLTCDAVCSDPIKYLEAEPHIPTCVCKNVSLELLPADSDCILPPGMECGEGRALRAARCMVAGRDVPMDICKKFHPLTGPSRVLEASTDGYTYDDEFKALLRGPCSVRCARDCSAGAWGQWGPCAAEAGSRAAFRFRTREVIEESSGGGRECGATLQRATCRLRAPRWRAGEWAPCAPQDALCGRAIVNRTLACVDEDGKLLEEAACEVSAAGPPPARETTCRAPCPADCVVSTWSDWSPCEVVKWGGGRRDRTRVVLRAAEPGGAACPHLVAAEPCSPHTYSWHLAPWDDCQPLGGSPCGEGVKRRAVRCLRNDGVFVNDTFCPNATATEARETWCYVPCGVDCSLGEWGPWDTSACTCGDGSNGPLRHMRRTRQHLAAAVWPGRACPPTEQRAPCPRDPCLKLVARPALGCHVMKVSGDPAEQACGWGVRVSQVRCELAGASDAPAPAPDASLQPWRCVDALPGRVLAPPHHVQEEECEIECGRAEPPCAPTGPWGAWGPCRGGARSRTRELHGPPSAACRSSRRYVTIEWANCSVSAVQPAEREGETTGTLKTVIYDKTQSNPIWYIGGTIFVPMIPMLAYSGYMIYRSVALCFNQRKEMKTVTKV